MKTSARFSTEAAFFGSMKASPEIRMFFVAIQLELITLVLPRLG